MDPQASASPCEKIEKVTKHFWNCGTAVMQACLAVEVPTDDHDLVPCSKRGAREGTEVFVTVDQQRGALSALDTFTVVPCPEETRARSCHGDG